MDAEPKKGNYSKTRLQIAVLWEHLAEETIYGKEKKEKRTNIYTIVDNTMLEKSYDAYIIVLNKYIKKKRKKKWQNVCVS